MSSGQVRPSQPPTCDGAKPELEAKSAALSAVAAAAALRSEAVLWKALNEALRAGADWEELEKAIDTAARVAESAVAEDGLRTLREVRARHGAKERWDITDDE